MSIRNIFKLFILLFILISISNCSNLNKSNRNKDKIDKMQRVIESIYGPEIFKAKNTQINFNIEAKKWEFTYSFGVPDGYFKIQIENEFSKQISVFYGFSKAQTIVIMGLPDKFDQKKDESIRQEKTIEKLQKTIDSIVEIDSNTYKKEGVMYDQEKEEWIFFYKDNMSGGYRIYIKDENAKEIFIVYNDSRSQKRMKLSKSR